MTTDQTFAAKSTQGRTLLAASRSGTAKLASGIVLFCGGTYLVTTLASAVVVSTLASVLVFAIIVISLNVIIGYTGQFSLGQLGFAALGAYGSAIGTIKLGLPSLVSVFLGIAVSLLVATVIGAVSFRTRGFYFSIVTLGFSLVVVSVLQGANSITGGSSGLVGVSALNLGIVQLASPRSIVFAGVAVYVVLTLYLRRLLRTRVGLGMRAVAVDESMAGALGINPFRVKMLALYLSAGIAALAGSLYASFLQIAVPDAFAIGVTIQTLVMYFFGGAGTFAGPFVGASLLLIELLYSDAGSASGLIDGIILAGVLIVMPAGIVGLVRLGARRIQEDPRWRDIVSRERARRVPSSDWLISAWKTPRWARQMPHIGNRGPSSKSLPKPRLDANGTKDPTALLEVRHLSHNFQGLKAVNDVSLTVREGEILAIIGPNGAGKTTLINLIAGQIPVQSGSVRFAGAELAGSTPWHRARLGIARTFQIPKLSMEATARENVLAGGYLHRSGGYLSAAFRPRQVREDYEFAMAEAHECLDLAGLTKVADRRVSELTSGQVRLVDVARSLMLHPRLLLLDEPAGGFIDAERTWLGQVIGRIRDSGVTICIIEHNMDLVLSIADKILAVDFGTVLASGAPAEVTQDEAVRRAYLGMEVGSA